MGGRSHRAEYAKFVGAHQHEESLEWAAFATGVCWPGVAVDAVEGSPACEMGQCGPHATP